MASALILEFTGVGRDQYAAVNRQLGIDMESGDGEWPDGLLSHAAGPSAAGWVVVEVWASRQDQERFMNGRLGRALQEGGITTAPSRVDWIDLVAYHTPGRRTAAR
jgi:hypothetical protein